MPLSHYTHVLTQWKIDRRAKRNISLHLTFHYLLYPVWLCMWQIIKNLENLESWQHTDKKDRVVYFWNETGSQLLNCVILKEIQTINIVFWLFNVLWQITVLPQFKHMNRSSFHIYLKHEINMNKYHKVFNFNHGTHNFSSLSPLNLICSSVWFVVKARRNIAAATGHAHLCIFQANNITWNL